MFKQQQKINAESIILLQVGMIKREKRGICDWEKKIEEKPRRIEKKNRTFNYLERQGER